MTNWFEPSVWTGLRALLAAVKSSPIVVKPLLRTSVMKPADWASVRKSGNADAFVLAWLASQARDARNPRVLM
jgi:hypothetical protein